VILTDDQPNGTLDAMPNVRSMIKSRGLTFTNGVIPTSLCCPSRSALLTGNQSHTTGVYTNEPKRGGWITFHNNGWERKNIALALDAKGYRTGLFGKYLNGFSQERPAGYTPPGWDVFRAFLPAPDMYYNYQLTGDDTFYGTRPQDYSTDVIGSLATQFVQESSSPYFMYFAPYGPHGPMQPAPRDEGTWPLVAPEEIPALNEANVSDKPAWVRQRQTVDVLEQQTKLTLQHEALMSIDDAVQSILNAADLSNTLVIYLSDNGFMLGSHRLVGKDVPYVRASEVPMMIRWDGRITPGRTQRVTPQIDLTALIRDAAGAALPMEGVNPLLHRRGGVAVEQVGSSAHPGYCGWRSRRYLYVAYDNRRGEELYDYRVDPDELRNKIKNPSYAEIVDYHRALAQAGCSPRPPGFTWN
jgi:arylsulfatase A-like enzyme